MSARSDLTSSGGSDTSGTIETKQDTAPLIQEWTEISGLLVAGQNRSLRLEKARSECTALLVQCLVLQIRYGCEDSNCSNTTCFSYKQRFATAPIRRPTPLTARNEAFELARLENPLAYLCTHALRVGLHSDVLVNTAAVICVIKARLAGGECSQGNDSAGTGDAQLEQGEPHAHNAAGNDIDYLNADIAGISRPDPDYSRQLQVDKSSLRQVFFNMQTVREAFSPASIIANEVRPCNMIPDLSPQGSAVQVLSKQQQSTPSNDQPGAIVVANFTFLSMAKLASLARSTMSRGLSPLSPFILRSLSYNLSMPSQLLNNYEYPDFIEYPMLFRISEDCVKDTTGKPLWPLCCALFDVSSFQAWQPVPEAFTVILNNLWHCLDAVFTAPPEIASKTEYLDSSSKHQYLDDSQAARLLYIAIVALIGTNPSGSRALLEDVLAHRNRGSTGIPSNNESSSSMKMHAYNDIASVFEFEPALRLAKKIVNAFGIRRSFWYAMRSLRGESTDDGVDCFPLMTLVTANMHWYLRSKTSHWNLYHVPQMLMQDFLDAIGMSPGLIFLEWVKTIFRTTWNGQTVLNRWSGAGASLEIMSDLWNAWHLDSWGLRESVDFMMPNIAVHNQLEDYKVSSEYSHWAIKHSPESTFHKNNRHIFHYPFIFNNFQRTTYFRAMLYEQMYAAHASARMTRNLHGQFATILSPRLSDYQCSSQDCHHAVCERQRFMRRQVVRWQAAGYTNDDQFPGSFWNRGVYLSHKLRKTEAKYLVLNVRREHLLEDAFDQLWGREERELRKPLKVRMGMDGEGEEGVDHGGVAQEFFRLVLAKAFDPSHGMFVTTDEKTNMNWFRPLSPEPLQTFELVGLLIGLAIFNGITLPLNFPQALYLHLCGDKRREASIADGWPGIDRSLRELIDWDVEENGSVEDVFALDYAYSFDTVDGKKYTVDLKGNDFPSALEAAWPGPRDPIPPAWAAAAHERDSVSYANRLDYTNRYVVMMLFVSVSPQLSAFTKGFRHLICDEWTRFLLPPTLQNLVEGWRYINLAELRLVTRYENDYTLSTPIIQWFWEIVLEYDQVHAKKLLTFVTASDRVPSQGWRGVRFSITRNGGDADRLPTSSTCFGKLLLPQYESKAKLARLLGRAIEEDVGFGNF